MEQTAVDGESPVYDSLTKPSGILSSAEHEKFCVNRPGPSGKAEYGVRPIVNEYCEGKVKSTSNRGVK